MFPEHMILSDSNEESESEQNTGNSKNKDKRYNKKLHTRKSAAKNEEGYNSDSSTIPMNINDITDLLNYDSNDESFMLDTNDNGNNNNYENDNDDENNMSYNLDIDSNKEIKKFSAKHNNTINKQSSLGNSKVKNKNDNSQSSTKINDKTNTINNVLNDKNSKHSLNKNQCCNDDHETVSEKEVRRTKRPRSSSSESSMEYKINTFNRKKIKTQ